jgi:hypothetical protein
MLDAVLFNRAAVGAGFPSDSNKKMIEAAMAIGVLIVKNR